MEHCKGRYIVALSPPPEVASEFPALLRKEPAGGKRHKGQMYQGDEDVLCCGLLSDTGLGSLKYTTGTYLLCNISLQRNCSPCEKWEPRPVLIGTFKPHAGCHVIPDTFQMHEERCGEIGFNFQFFYGSCIFKSQDHILAPVRLQRRRLLLLAHCLFTLMKPNR